IVRYTIRFPSGEYDGNPLLFAPLVTLWKFDPSCPTIPICTPPFTGSTGFFAPTAKSRNDANFPIPKTTVLSSGDHCGPRISSPLPSRIGRDRPAGPVTSSVESVRFGASAVDAYRMPRWSNAGSALVLSSSYLGFRLHSGRGAGGPA